MKKTDSFEQNPIRVGVADDYPVVLRGVESILGSCEDLKLVFSADNIEQLLKLLKHAEIDVLLCDYVFDDAPHADGLTLLRRICRDAPDVRVIFLSSHARPHIISSALEAGASGFIGKDKADFVSLPQAIRKVHAGQVFLPPSLSANLVSQLYGQKASATGTASLSERELMVVRMICAGMSISLIAEKLCRSRKTISNQKLAAMKKLGASSDLELSQIYRDLMTEKYDGKI